MDEQGSVIIVTGPPGAGKTTIARKVADASERPSVHLYTDSFYVAIRKGYVEPYRPDAQKQNETVIGVIVDAAFGYARGGYDVFVDGILGPWALDPFRAAARRVGIALSYILLRPSRDVALARAQARAAPQLRDAGSINVLYDFMADAGALEPHVIDTTQDSIDATMGARSLLVARSSVSIVRGSIGAGLVEALHLFRTELQLH